MPSHRRAVDVLKFYRRPGERRLLKSSLARGLAVIAMLVVAAMLPMAGCSTDSTSVADPNPSPTPTSAERQGNLPRTGDQEKEELEAESFLSLGWDKTDFSIRSVSLSEFRRGGPGKDDISPIDRPKFEAVQEADKWLDDRVPVQTVEINGDARAYPQQILILHEVVNDVVGEEPVVVTF